jgi:hypothetical protein
MYPAGDTPGAIDGAAGRRPSSVVETRTLLEVTSVAPVAPVTWRPLLGVLVASTGLSDRVVLCIVTEQVDRPVFALYRAGGACLIQCHCALSLEERHRKMQIARSPALIEVDLAEVLTLRSRRRNRDVQVDFLARL